MASGPGAGRPPHPARRPHLRRWPLGAHGVDWGTQGALGRGTDPAQSPGEGQERGDSDAIGSWSPGTPSLQLWQCAQGKREARPRQAESPPKASGRPAQGKRKARPRQAESPPKASGKPAQGRRKARPRQAGGPPRVSGKPAQGKRRGRTRQAESLFKAGGEPARGRRKACPRQAEGPPKAGGKPA